MRECAKDVVCASIFALEDVLPSKEINSTPKAICYLLWLNLRIAMVVGFVAGCVPPGPLRYINP